MDLDSPDTHAEARAETLRTLVVVLHGWRMGADSMDDIKKVVLATYGEATVLCAPILAYSGRLSSVRAVQLVRDVLAAIDEDVARHEPQRIVFVAHSLGATIARRVFLVASGNPTDFSLERELRGEQPRNWAASVDRIVLLSAFNRGWAISDRMSWRYSILFNLAGLLGHILPGNWSPTIFDFRLGAPFMVQTRLHWMAYRRAHVDEQRRVSDNVHCPILIQMIGTRDDLVSPLDQIDISVDGTGRALAAKDQGVVQKVGGANDEVRDYYLIETPMTDHMSAVVLFGSPDADKRREYVVKALGLDRRGLDEPSIDPGLLADEVDAVDETVQDTVFVIHGIRDDGFWTHRVAERIRSKASDTSTRIFRGWTPTYGYFAMLAFILPWVRRRKVEWFMDQYVTAFAQYPKSDFHYVGHSNGTYLAARALLDYPAFHLKHVFFAGSVVRIGFPWTRMLEHGRVKRFQNIVASADAVVAWLPKSVDYWWKFDLGGAGFDGFDDARTNGAISELRFVSGGHGAGIIEQHWDQIADFIIDGTPLGSAEGPLYASRHNRFVEIVGATRIVMPLLILITAVLIPFCCLFAHVDLRFSLEWTGGRVLLLCLYILLLRFVITRV